ncbi:MAG TPA: RNA polymerase sigma factor [Acidimicrobiales bacterium]|nr:RNA polymerase sigma factor [Acidimicrobiales bacterium]
MQPEVEFSRLYETHRRAVHSYFVARSGDPWTAADLMQEVFIRAWRRLPEVGTLPTDQQRAWLFTVARNLSIDNHRRCASRPTVPWLEGQEPPGTPAIGADTAVAAERLEAVAAGIRSLPEAQRVALSLTVAGGLTSEQAAGALGVPAGTVRYRLSTARHALAEALNHYDDPRPPEKESEP